MSETKPVKVFKKIKIKKAVPAPLVPEPVLDEELLAAPQPQEFIDELPLPEEPEIQKPAQIEENNDDDEFERLLNEFISSELDDVETEIEEVRAGIPQPKETPPPPPLNTPEGKLEEEERALYLAYRNYTDSINIMAQDHGKKAPNFRITAEMLFPRYKPKTGNKIARDILLGWDVILETYPLNALNISPTAGDEELLDFAEKVTDDALQLAIISYVEILIEIESCEISYEERRLKAQRHKIEREIYEEHQSRINRIKKYIKAVEEKKFPVNAERLINNYFKTSQKDPDGAYKILITNPAVYAPIDVSKIKPRLFGLIKPTPQDGLRVNKELGDFIKNLKI